jgi:protein-disulfide isomerase
MNRSPLFLGTITLLAVILLMVYGISAIAPLFEIKEDAPPTLIDPLANPAVDFGNPTLGSSDAKLDIVVFGNYQCPSCAAFDMTVQNVQLEFSDEVRLIWKDTPNTALYPQSRNAAIAARCAREQGLFWEYHNRLMDSQSSISEANFPIMALELGLNGDLFRSCYDDRRPDYLIQRDIDEAIALGVNATPYVFIGNQKFAGALREDALRQVIQTELDRLADQR